MGKTEIRLTIVNDSGARVPRAFLEQWMKSLARLAAREIPAKSFAGKELVIAFVDEKRARALNKEFRGKDYATDVLSFDAMEPGSLGELVICPKVIAKQAKEHGLLVREELGYMVLHGFLHLLGYDHENVSEKKARAMFALQDALFEKLFAGVA